MKKNFLWSLLAMIMAVSLGYGLASCGDDEERENSEGPSTEIKKTTKTVVDIPTDPNYKPAASDIQKIWVGEYEGWDAVQKKNTTIRRRLALNPNGTYTNTIAGKLIESDKNKFFLFESEGGKYTYNSATGIVSYTCEYDSVLNYRDQSYTRYSKKHYYSKEETNYTEYASFSEMQQGKRVWITKDMYLQSLTAEVLDLQFSMSVYNGENQKDQNK